MRKHSKTAYTQSLPIHVYCFLAVIILLATGGCTEKTPPKKIPLAQPIAKPDHAGSVEPASSNLFTRPVTSFKGDKAILQPRIAFIKGLDSAALRSLYQKKELEGYPPRPKYDNALRAAIGLWENTGEKQYQEIGIAACRAALGDLLETPDDILCSRISDKGGRDEQNFVMRDACYQFALLHHLTKDNTYARKSAALLAKFAEEIPNWKIYTPHWGPWEERTPHPQDWPGLGQASDTISGFWGEWMFFDIEKSVPLLEAYDLIYNADAMQSAGTLDAIEKMLHGHVELEMRFGRFLCNLDAGQMRGILVFARILNQPEWVHYCVQWGKDLYKTQFYADGWWHEGTTSYHRQIHGGLQWVMNDFLKGYSDPPGFKSELDGTRFDNLDIEKIMAGPWRRADAVMQNMVDPNGLQIAVHDTCWPENSYKTIQAAHPVLFGGMGHAILGTGTNKGAMTQASLHFGGTHGHAHDDCLNLILFAKGRELISETKYRPEDRGSEATNTTREWHTMTAGHVTVVVDNKDQRGTGTRTKQPSDDIPGIPDWPWRWGGHGNAMNDGKLRLFNTDFESVQVAEADGERAYTLETGRLRQYRRTIALVKISENDCYLVDIFRVRGGQTHDYMLHSCLDFPHSVKLSLPLSGKRSGALHTYIQNLRTALTDQGWSATFNLQDNSTALKTFFLPQKGTEIILGDGPAMRRQGTAPFLAVRHTGKESVFVAVHHPYVGEPIIKAVDILPVLPANGAVAIRVTLPNRRDTIISTTDKKPYPKRQCGKIFFSGGFAHMAEGGQSNSWSYLVDDFELRMEGKVFRGATSFEGVLERTHRIEAGNEFNAFETTVPLPCDGSLNGRTLMVEFYDDSLTWIEQQSMGGLLVQSFRIDKITRSNGRTLIHTPDEPGMTITPGLVKLEYYPCWGVRGEARFRIAGSALFRPN